jgi:biopolymer transport protein ExbB
MAKGISEALITTATGLIIAIPTMIVYRFLENYIDRVVSEMERVSLRFLNLRK